MTCGLTVRFLVFEGGDRILHEFLKILTLVDSVPLHVDIEVFSPNQNFPSEFIERKRALPQSFSQRGNAQ